MAMITLAHQNFIAEIELDAEQGLFSGIVLNTRATLHFAGRSVEELKAAFAETIEDYRAWCRRDWVEPEKPYSGTLSLRLSPELHRRVAVAVAAAKAGKSVNAYIGERLEAGV